ncbi:MAG: hypothetical protein RIT03_598 [Bacteroidota bacterium]|jgi:hypothetical protein
MKKITALISIFILTSCHYSKDKLVIKNNSKLIICYETLIKNRTAYYQISGGGKIKSFSFDSPPVRGNSNSIKYALENESIDKILYVVYYDLKDLEYVNKNLNTIISNKNFQTDTYTLKELNSLNWEINFPNKVK